MDNKELRTLAIKVLEDSYVMSLGTIDEDGVWVSDVVYIHDENFNLYWISKLKTRHSQAIEKNKKVACTITASWKKNQERALQIEGTAIKGDKIPLEFEQRLEAKQDSEIPKTLGEILKDGNVWYVLKPTKVELIHSKPFGYEKKYIDLK